MERTMPKIVGSQAYNADTIEGPNAELAKDLWKANEEVLAKHPQAVAILALVYTPRPHDHPDSKPHASSHTAVVTGENHVKSEDLTVFLQYAIRQLIDLYKKVITADPSTMDIMEVKE
jgi:hypothetical protein